MSAAALSPVEDAPYSPADAWPRVGERWRAIYDIREQLPETTAGRSWRATRVDTAEAVTLRAFHPAAGEGRAEVWKKLCAIDSPHLARARTTFVVEDCHVEETETPSGLSLSRWRRTVQEFAPAEVEALTRDLAAALTALHAAGLVHLGVQPGVVFVREEDGKFQFILGALESVTRFERDKLIPASVDPFYAPPEAAGLFQHSPGPELRAWDWWSLGRVVQDMVLGGHVLGHILEREIFPATAEMTSRMEAMLLERDAAGLRAGAVEAMPTCEKRVDTLLRGLLTSARDGRWGRDEVQGWLRHEAVRHRYGLPRHERLFRLCDRPLTVPEAADALRTPELWPEIVPHSFNIKQPGTLAHFIDDSIAHRPFLEKLTDALKLAESDALRTYPGALVREVVAALALQNLANNHFVWRGRAVDAAALREWLDGTDDPKARLELARLLTQRVVVGQIQRSDAEDAQLLGDLGRIAGEAELQAITSGWLKQADTAGILRLWLAALGSPADLQACRARLRQRFACCSNAAMNKIFQGEKLLRPEQVLLVWAERDATKFGFVTHEEWAAKRLLELRASGEKLAAALFWRRLAKALRAGTWLFARWRLLVPIWLTVVTLGLIARPGPRWLVVALLPALLAAGWRVLAHRGHAVLVKKFSPGAAPWGWRDGVKRCGAEAEATAPGLNESGLLRLIGEVNADIAKLDIIKPPPAPIALPPRFGGTWFAAGASWLAVLLVVATHGWQIKLHPPTLESLRAAWTLSKSAPPVEAATPDKPVKVSWPHKPVGEIHVVNLKGHEEATLEQRTFALAKGKALVEPYKPETIGLFIALRVPAPDNLVGMMLFNGKTGALVNQHVYLSIYEPLPRMWIELSGIEAIYIIP